MNHFKKKVYCIIHLGDTEDLDFYSQYDDFVIGFETQSLNSAYDH